MNPSDSQRGDFGTGAEFGVFAIEEILGRGNMGVVYRARDRHLDRPVALKVVASHYAADPEFRERFLAEARIAATVEHPGIVTVYSAGEEEGIPFIAMRLIDGGELSDLISQRGQIGITECAQILGPIARALDSAAARGLVHRDVKPSNILLPNDGSGAVLVDFGVGRIQGSTRATQSGSWIGTAGYVSPEQIQGRDVGGEADQYSLACVLYEMLSGSPPFERQDTVQTLWAHVNDSPTSLVGKVVGWSAQHDEVMARALAKDPAGRFSTCEAFIGAIAGVPLLETASGTVIAAKPAGLGSSNDRGEVIPVAVPAEASRVDGNGTESLRDDRDSAHPATVIERPATDASPPRTPEPGRSGGSAGFIRGRIAVAIAASALVIVIGFFVVRAMSSEAPDAQSAGGATAVVDKAADGEGEPQGTDQTQSASDAVVAEFGSAVNALWGWREMAGTITTEVTNAYNKCLEDPASRVTCMRETVSDTRRNRVVGRLALFPKRITAAYDAGVGDSTFASGRKECTSAAQEYALAAKKRANRLEVFYGLLLSGDESKARTVQAQLDREIDKFNKQEAGFKNECRVFRAR